MSSDHNHTGNAENPANPDGRQPGRAEQLSALYDGQTSRTEGDALAATLDAELLQSWHSYAITGAALRKEPLGAPRLGDARLFCAAVRRRLHVGDERRTQMPQIRLRDWLDAWGRTLGQTALAASVAALTVVAVHRWQAPVDAVSMPPPVAIPALAPVQTVSAPQGRAPQQTGDLQRQRQYQQMLQQIASQHALHLQQLSSQSALPVTWLPHHLQQPAAPAQKPQ